MSRRPQGLWLQNQPGGFLYYLLPIRCLKDLEVPHFHHELVYEAVVMVIESMHEKTDEAMCKLLQALFRSFVITIEQMRAGFQRVYDQMVDISIDVPQAYSVLERWVLRCRQVCT